MTEKILAVAGSATYYSPTLPANDIDTSSINTFVLSVVPIDWYRVRTVTARIGVPGAAGGSGGTAAATWAGVGPPGPPTNTIHEPA